ncbi:MAG: transposase, partial [Phycisphaerae bacterium]|nr:transposase [Phycisphaerae bacterium]
PIHYSWDRRDRLSVISAITVSPTRRHLGLYFDVHDHNINTDTFESFVRWLRHQVRRGIVLVVDRWSVHRSGVRRLLDRFGSKVQVEWLPPYAPELNPVEQVWSHTKYADLANYIPDDAGALAEEVIDSLDQAGKSQSLLRSFFHHAKLRL